MVLMSNAVIFFLLLKQQMENAEAERDVYDELLTQAEIQGNVNKVNGKSHEHPRTFIYRFVHLSWFPWYSSEMSTFLLQ